MVRQKSETIANIKRQYSSHKQHRPVEDESPESSPKRRCSDEDEDEEIKVVFKPEIDYGESNYEYCSESPSSLQCLVQIEKSDDETDGGILQEILEIVRATEVNVKKLQQANMELIRQVQCLRNENIKLRTQFKLNSETPNEETINIMPKTPFSCVEEFKLFEDKIKNSNELRKNLENEIFKSMININDPGKFIRSTWKSFITDEVANRYSWRGSHDKETVKYLTLTVIIRDAFNRRFVSSEKRFDFCTVRWFQTANDRLKYKKKTSDSTPSKDPLTSRCK